MAYEIRPITEDEFPKLARVLSVAFGDTDEDAEHERHTTFEYDRSISVRDGDRFIGSAGAYSFELTLPGGTRTPAAGVTWVGVVSTHRRRGVLRSMMEHQLADVRERGEAVAILTASEGSIYGRFGYGMASLRYSAEIRVPAPFLAEVPGGRITLLETDEASKVLPGIYDRWRLGQPGAVTRRPEWWDMWFGDRPRDRDGGSARFYAVHESEPGTPDGYVAYRTKNGWDAAGLASGEVRVQEVVPLSAEAHAGLWRYCLDVDLMRVVKTTNLALDDPLRWRLRDPRRMRVTGATDFLWVRLVDVAGALAARRYEVEGELVIEVDDAFLPDNSGRYRLDGGPDGASAARTDAAPDVRMSVVDLGAAYLGAAPFTTLARAGRAEEVTPGALRRADAMFRSTPAAYSNTPF